VIIILLLKLACLASLAANILNLGW